MCISETSETEIGIAPKASPEAHLILAVRAYKYPIWLSSHLFLCEDVEVGDNLQRLSILIHSTVRRVYSNCNPRKWFLNIAISTNKFWLFPR